MHLLPTVGAAWLLHGPQDASMTPGQNEQPSLAGALPLATGRLLSGRGPRQNQGFLRDLCGLLAPTDPAAQMTRSDGVVDHDGMHKAKAVEQWWASHPRVGLR